MILVFFVYGLSFFLLGAAVFFQARRGSRFRLGQRLWLLAAFGLLHGLNEWLDMFLLLGDAYWAEWSVETIKVVRFFVGQVSYVFLFQFGICLIEGRRTKHPLPSDISLAFYSIYILVLLVWGLNVEFSHSWFVMSDATMRYILAFPGAFLTGLAFFHQRREEEIQALNARTVNSGLAGMAVAFWLYAVFAGLVVKPAPFFPASVVNYESFQVVVGLPVQIFRAGCAVAILFFLCRVLSIFELESHHKLQDAYREIIRISNQEQTRVGRDLHDGLGQQLAGISYMSKSLEQKLEQQDVSEAGEAREIRKLLDDCVETARTLSRGLYPVSLEENGLPFALAELAGSVERLFRVSCIAAIEDETVLPDNETALHLFRIAQEAVNNSVKHGKADTIRIELSRADHRLVLAVTDNGTGIPEDRDRTRGIGLRTMQYRAEVIGGELDIQTKMGEGTAIQCRISPSALT